MGIPVAELRLSQEYIVDGERLVISGFGRREFLESCDIAVPAGIGQEETCVVCSAANGAVIVRQAAAFAEAAVRSTHKGGQP